MERLIDVMPELADEIREVLFDMGEYKLAKSVAALSLVDRCRCGEVDCATFYTMERAKWQDKPLKHVVPGKDDILEVDVLDDTIVCVEILDREEISAVLRRLLP